MYNRKVATTMELLNIPTVCEFSNIFVEELVGMPPNQVVKLSIELMPGIAPVSMRYYWIPPNEFVELKKQIQKLLSKGFICLNS